MVTPMVTNLKKLHDAITRSDPVDRTQYRQLIGSLLYLVHSRPDICYAVSALSQFMSSPKHIHWIVAKHILWYLISMCFENSRETQESLIFDTALVVTTKNNRLQAESKWIREQLPKPCGFPGSNASRNEFCINCTQGDRSLFPARPGNHSRAYANHRIRKPSSNSDHSLLKESQGDQGVILFHLRCISVQGLECCNLCFLAIPRICFDEDISWLKALCITDIRSDMHQIIRSVPWTE